MARTRMWVIEQDRYGPTNQKFNVDDPLHIPRVGEFVDSDSAAGWVVHVQYNYFTAASIDGFSLVVNVYLGEKK